MAKILNGHFGSYQGKIGAVTGRKRKGTFYISQSITHNSSQTTKQKDQRNRFSAAAKALAPLANALMKGFSAYDTGMTALNAALGFNIGKVDSNFDLAYTDVVVARGPFVNVQGATPQNPGTGTLKMVWTNNADPNTNTDSDDVVYVVFHEPVSRATIMLTAKRGDASVQYSYPNSWANKDVYTWVFTQSVANGKISDGPSAGMINVE